MVMATKAVDLNHDGKPDVILSLRNTGPPSYQGRWLQILINNGDGTFHDETNTRLPQTDNTNTWFFAVYIVDIDGDGNLDLVGRVPFVNGSGDHWFAPGDVNGFFTPVALLPGGLDGVFALADVNGNGHRDFLAVGESATGLIPNTSAVLPPGIPQRVRAQSLTDRVRLTWPYVWGATSYEVWRAANGNAPAAIIGTATRRRSTTSPQVQRRCTTRCGP